MPVAPAEAAASASSSSSSSAAVEAAPPRARPMPRSKHDLLDCGFFAVVRYEDGISVPLKRSENNEEVPEDGPEWDVNSA